MATMNQRMSAGLPEKSRPITVDRAGPVGFQKLADRISKAAGSKWAFFLAVALVGIWAALGPYFQWSDAHQLFINTSTTIATFWMVFILQNSQNRADAALHTKLDELIRATETASNRVIGLEEKTESEIKAAADEIREAVEEPCGKATGSRLDD